MGGPPPGEMHFNLFAGCLVGLFCLHPKWKGLYFLLTSFGYAPQLRLYLAQTFLMGNSRIALLLTLLFYAFESYFVLCVYYRVALGQLVKFFLFATVFYSYSRELFEKHKVIVLGFAFDRIKFLYL